MASAASTTSSRPSSNPRDSPVSAAGRQKSIPNGLRRGQKPQLESDTTPSAESNTADQHSHDRLLFLTACAVGHRATITTITGDVFNGIFSGASLDKPAAKYVLKMTRKVSQTKENQVNGAGGNTDYTGHGDDHVMLFDPLEVSVCSLSDLQIAKVSSKIANGSASNFRTDTDISGNLAVRERELKPWDASTDGAIDMNLTANGRATWDQFEANERLYGVRTDYDENIYTTSIDRSHPTYKQRAAAAERKAREIEGAGNSNAHKAGLENEVDDEDRFSGVKRVVQPLTSTNPNSYKPPARRAPTGGPTIMGAPVDPAIISSQLARPDSAANTARSPSSSAQTLSDSTLLNTKENAVPDAVQPSKSQESKDSQPARKSESAKTPADTKADLAPHKASAPAASPGRSGNVAENVEKEMLRAFKDFSAHEKMRAQEKKRNQGQKERDVKINDLKKFASNFKLAKPVPNDLIGILAKDKQKQDEIIAKAQREAEEKMTQQKSVPPSEPSKPITPAQTELTKPPITTPVEPSGRGRGQGRGFQNSRHEKYNSTFGPNGVGRGGPPSSFGQRKMQQYPSGAMPNMPPLGPAALQTDLAMRPPMSGVPSSASSASRFNANALEFRPNPTASTFSPSANPSSMATSIAGSRPVSKAHSPAKRGFFEGQARPRHFSERPSIRDDFNPVKRMKKEAEADPKKARDFTTNGGIQPAYATKPTWDTRPENENRGSDDMFKQQGPPGMPPMVGQGMAMAHQHQLPLHLQHQGPHMLPPHMQGPHHNPRFSQPPPMHPNQQYHHDEHRMQVSNSQQSAYQSPRPVMASPMHGQPQPYMGQPQGVFVGQQGVPMGYARPASAAPQMFNAQTGQPMVMMNGPPNAQYMPNPGQHHVQMYSPAPGQAYPAQPGPGTPSYSPRAPPMMMHQGSQQGHAAPMMYMSQSQHGQPVYYGQQPGQPMHMRGGGYPMQPQNSYGGSPHIQQQYPMQQRGPQHYGGYPQQQMHPGPPHGEVK